MVQDFLSSPIFPIFFIVMWLAASFILAIQSGWRRLAEQFRALDEVNGQRFRFASGRVSRWKNASLWNPYGGVNFSNILFVTVSDNGFKLSVFFLFAAFMRPIFIPWSAIESIGSGRVLWARYVSITLVDNLGKISLAGTPGHALLSSCPARLREPARQN